MTDDVTLYETPGTPIDAIHDLGCRCYPHVSAKVLDEVAVAGALAEYRASREATTALDATVSRLRQELDSESMERADAERQLTALRQENERYRVAVEAAILNIQHDRIGAAIAGLRVARDLNRAVLETK